MEINHILVYVAVFNNMNTYTLLLCDSFRTSKVAICLGTLYLLTLPREKNPKWGYTEEVSGSERVLVDQCAALTIPTMRLALLVVAHQLR